MSCVIEGLGGLGKSMNQFYLDNEREFPNCKKFKMIYNPDIKFKERIYQDFNCAIKKIKLRDTISFLISKPDVYLRSKVQENMYEVIQQFGEIRKLERLNLVNEFNLFPSTENLLVLERKYGDSLSHYDINGCKQKKKRKQKQVDGAILVDDHETKTEGRTAKTADTRTDARTTYTEDKTNDTKSTKI